MSGLRVGRVVAVVAAAAVVLSGCSALHAIRGAVRAARSVEADHDTVTAFTQRLQSSENLEFEAVYTTTGSAPSTILYAADPPDDLALHIPDAGGTPGTTQFITNASGEYVCTPGASAPPSCEKFGMGSNTGEESLVDLYTPSHWVQFLNGLSLAAGVAGDTVTKSTMTVNGFALQCVDLVAHGVPGTSSICTTAQGILGYVKVATSSTSFEITSYSTSPSPSLFELPANATVTTPTT